MQTTGSGLIVDLSTDSSRDTVPQIIQAAREKLSLLITSNEQQVERDGGHMNKNTLDSPKKKQQHRQKGSYVSGQLHRANAPHHVIVLSQLELASPPIPSSTVLVSQDPLDLLFKAKTELDKTPGSGCEVQVVTSAAMKKFWEAACLHLFSPVTTWSVWGVVVEGQELTLKEPVDTVQMEGSLRKYLMTVGDLTQVNVWRSDLIPGAQFNAGFHDRSGGVSQLGPVASMNMVYTPYKPDSLLVVQENRRRLAQVADFNPNAMYVTKAEHGRTVWVVGAEQPPRYDGIVTDKPGVTVCAAGADCCMILLADVHTGSVGAVHCGWRGTTLMAVKALLHAMVREFGTQPHDIRATIGPSVCGDHFLLLPEEAKPITDLDSTLTWPSKQNPHMVHIDLVRANVIQLRSEGVPERNIDTSLAVCTVENAQFFSYERDGKPFGNQVGFISRRPG